MNLTSVTTRLPLVPLLAAGLLAGGFATPPPGSPARGKDCCLAPVVTSACCGRPCCQAPAPQPDRSAGEHFLPAGNRLADGKIAWAGAFTLDRDHGQADAGDRPYRVPSSGSPSLITQHVRLQI